MSFLCEKKPLITAVFDVLSAHVGSLVVIPPPERSMLFVHMYHLCAWGRSILTSLNLLKPKTWRNVYTVEGQCRSLPQSASGCDVDVSKHAYSTASSCVLAAQLASHYCGDQEAQTLLLDATEKLSFFWTSGRGDQRGWAAPLVSNDACPYGTTSLCSQSTSTSAVW